MDELTAFRNDLEDRAEAAGGRRGQWWRFIEEVVGYASPEGEDEDNLSLSMRRASDVADFLFAGTEVEWEDLVEGVGEDHEGAGCSEEGYPEWRRVAIRLRDVEFETPSTPRDVADSDEPETALPPEDIVRGVATPGDIVEDTVRTAGDVAQWAEVAVGTIESLGVVGLETVGAGLGVLNGILFEIFAVMDLGDALNGYDEEIAYSMGWSYGFTSSATDNLLPIPVPAEVIALGVDDEFHEGVNDGRSRFLRYQVNVCPGNDRRRTRESIERLNRLRREAASDLPQMEYNEWFCLDMDPSNPQAWGSDASAELIAEQVRYLQVINYAQADPQAFLNRVWQSILAAELTAQIDQAVGEAAGRNEIGWPNFREERPRTGYTGRRNQ